MRFMRRGKGRTYFLPTVADMAAPTRIEITAGELLSADLTEINGFEINGTTIDAPDELNSYTSKVAGEDTSPDSSLTFHDQDNSEDVRLALAKDTVGVLVFCPYGDVAAKRCETWPVLSLGYNDIKELGNTTAKARANFAITGTPVTDAVIPALT